MLQYKHYSKRLRLKYTSNTTKQHKEEVYIQSLDVKPIHNEDDPKIN